MKKKKILLICLPLSIANVSTQKTSFLKSNFPRFFKSVNTLVETQWKARCTVNAVQFKNIQSGYKTDIDASHKKGQRSLLSGSAGLAEA